MATTTATVIPEGLALAPEFMAEHNLEPGTRVGIIVQTDQRRIPDDFERLLRETRGMFASSGGGMAEELQRMRREDEQRFQAKLW